MNIKKLLVTGCFLISFSTFEVRAQEEDDWFLASFVNYKHENAPPSIGGAGYSAYITIWSFQQTHPGGRFQSGLPSVWMSPAENPIKPTEFHCTIEGGLGWWQGTNFPTTTPKFMLGATSSNFFEWTNGPGNGGGIQANADDWDIPQGKYGTAHLSNKMFWPLDGLNIAHNQTGRLFGYGYTPLPFIEPQTSSLGEDIETGNHAWTLFLNTANFKGPLAFVIPNFFSKPVIEDRNLEGTFLDALESQPVESLGFENQLIPTKVVAAANGVFYAKIRPTLFPATGASKSKIFADFSVYSKNAMWDKVKNWFEGNETPSTEFEPTGTFLKELTSEKINGKVLVESYEFFDITFEGINDEDEHEIDWDQLAERVTDNSHNFEYRWISDLIEPVGSDHFKIPEYYRLDNNDEAETGKIWQPIAPSDVPVETGLVAHVFEDQPVIDSSPILTPTAADSLWKTPGPTAGPFTRNLADGTIVTYYWYRFIDQPSIRYWNFSEEILQKLQQRVSLIHQNWGIDDTYFAPPTSGELANVDSEQLVTPPVGLEFGYVPIVTRQEKLGDLIFSSGFELD